MSGTGRPAGGISPTRPYTVGVATELTTAYGRSILWGVIRYANLGFDPIGSANYPKGNPLSSFMWCPAQSPDGGFQPGNTNARQTYMYNPHRDISPPTSPTSFFTPWPRLTGAKGLPANRALSLDLVLDIRNAAHVDEGKTAYFNLLFPDGHVATVNSTDTYKAMAAIATSTLYNLSNAAGQWQAAEN